MADSQHNAGIRISGDAQGAVDATKQVADEQKKLAEQTRRTNETAKAAAEESKRFVERMKEQAETVGKTRAEAERYRASQLSLTEAQRRSVDVSIRQIEAYDKKQQALTFVGRAAAAATVLILGYATAVAASAKGTIDQAAALHNLSQSYGIATTTLSAYQYQMKLAGVGQGEFTLSMKALAKNISEARGGSGDGATIFKLLGRDIESAVRAGASMEELLPRIADKFASFADGPNKAALAMAVFGGRVGEQLIPELNKGAAGFQAAAREAAEFGRIVGGDTARQAEEFNTNLARMNTLLSASGQAITNAALPALNRYLEQLIAGTRIAGGFWAALGRFGGMSSNPDAALANANQSIEELRAARANFARLRGYEGQIAKVDQSILAQQQRAQFAQFLINQRLGEGGRDPNSPLFEFAGGGVVPPKAQAPGLPRAGGGGRTAAQIMAELSDVSPTFTEDLKTLHAEYASGAISLDTYRAAVEKLIQAQKFAQELAKEEADWLTENTKWIDERRQAWVDEGVARANAETAMETSVEALERETSLMVLSNEERERAIALFGLEQQALTLSAEKYDELAQRINAVYDRRRELAAQDERIKAALESQRAIDEQSQKSAQAFETAVATGIMLGFRRGGGNLAQSLRRTIEDAIWTATLTPLATRIGGAFGGFGQALAGQGGSMVAGAGNWLATSALGQRMGWSTLSEDAAGNVTVAPTSGFQSSFASSIPFIGAAIAALSVGANRDTRGQLDVLGPYGEKLFGRSYNQSLNPVGSWMRGQISRGDMFGAMLAPGLIRVKSDADRAGFFGGGLGEGAYGANRWFGGDMASALSSFQQGLAGQEQALIRNLGLSPERIARVNEGLQGTFGREYGFGRERTPVEQSGVFQQIQADRLAAISQALGKSIEDLTRIMSMSTEQWQAAIDTMRAQLEAGERALNQHVRGLPGQLGITGLEGFLDSLAIAPDQAPLDRVGAGLDLYRRTRERALGGELGAVLDLPRVGGEVLGVGRDVYASGQGFQDLRKEIVLGIEEVSARQQELQLDIMKEVPVTILQASQNEIEEIRKQTTALVAQFELLRREFTRLTS